MRVKSTPDVTGETFVAQVSARWTRVRLPRPSCPPRSRNPPLVVTFKSCHLLAVTQLSPRLWAGSRNQKYLLYCGKFFIFIFRVGGFLLCLLSVRVAPLTGERERERLIEMTDTQPSEQHAHLLNVILPFLCFPPACVIVSRCELCY